MNFFDAVTLAVSVIVVLGVVGYYVIPSWWEFRRYKREHPEQEPR